MKFTKNISPKGLRLPVSAARLAGMEDGEKVEYHTGDNAIVVLKGHMTAMELLRAAQSLQDLAANLHTHLAKVCGYCDGCDGALGEFCPVAGIFEPDVTLRDDLRREAGIPENAKLCATADREKHTVSVFAADYDYDLRDVPEEILEMFADANVCLGELEERLILDNIVYGN